MAKKNETKKITITEALAQLKLMDKRIMKGTKVSIVGYSIGDKPQQNFDAAEIKKNWQSLQDLISARSVLKMAINKSNLITKVTVAGVKMTVLEAKATYWYKESILSPVIQ